MGSTEGALRGAAKKTGCTLDEWKARRAAGLLWCWSCKSWKRVDDFVSDGSRSTGRASRCRPCASDAATASRYGLSVEEVEVLRSTGCSICGRSENLVIDHDHETERVRGALCNRCNVGLGLFLDNADLLRSALAYLEKHDG